MHTHVFEVWTVKSSLNLSTYKSCDDKVNFQICKIQRHIFVIVWTFFYFIVHFISSSEQYSSTQAREFDEFSKAYNILIFFFCCKGKWSLNKKWKVKRKETWWKQRNSSFYMCFHNPYSFLFLSRVSFGKGTSKCTELNVSRRLQQERLKKVLSPEKANRHVTCSRHINFSLLLLPFLFLHSLCRMVI